MKINVLGIFFWEKRNNAEIFWRERQTPFRRRSQWKLNNAFVRDHLALWSTGAVQGDLHWEKTRLLIPILYFIICRSNICTACHFQYLWLQKFGLYSVQCKECCMPCHISLRGWNILYAKMQYCCFFYGMTWLSSYNIVVSGEALIAAEAAAYHFRIYDMRRAKKKN